MESESIRQKLSQTLYNSRVPKLNFVADRTHLAQEVNCKLEKTELPGFIGAFQEMNRLFEIADYGMQYRAVSRTAAVLGPSSAGVAKEDANPEKVPRWLQARIEKKLARKHAREAALSAEESADAEGNTDAQPPADVPSSIVSKV